MKTENEEAYTYICKYIYIYKYRHVALHRLNYISAILLHVLIAPNTCLFRPERLAVLSFQLIRVVCSVWEEGRHIARVCLFSHRTLPWTEKNKSSRL